jgi:hypothetical protein
MTQLSTGGKATIFFYPNHDPVDKNAEQPIRQCRTPGTITLLCRKISSKKRLHQDSGYNRFYSCRRKA